MEKKYPLLLKVTRWDSVQGSDGLDNGHLSLKIVTLHYLLVIQPIFNHVLQNQCYGFEIFTCRQQSHSSALKSFNVLVK